MAENLKRGDYVSWNSSGGTARGRIDLIVRNGDVPGIDVKVTGTEDDPAARIIIYRPKDDGWEATDTKVGHKWSTLTKIDPLPEPTGDDEESAEQALQDMELSSSIDYAQLRNVPVTFDLIKSLEKYWQICAPDPDELDQVYADYQAITNMGAAELRRWKDNPCSSAAGEDKSPIDRNIELKDTNKSDWTEKHIRWANRTISFVSRMLGNESGEPVSES